MAPRTVLYLHETARMAGAEQSLLQLARRIDRGRFEPLFILPEEGPFSAALTQNAVETLFVRMPPVRRLAGVWQAVSSIARAARERRAALIHSNSIRTHLYAAAAARMTGVPLVWHERNLVTTERIDPERILMSVPDAIVCNSRAIAGRFYVRGAMPSKVTVIYNGVDSDAFTPAVDGNTVRSACGIGPDETVIGIASRFHEGKGHETFFRAARILSRRFGATRHKPRFLIAGGSVFAEDVEREGTLRRMVDDLGLGTAAIFAGQRGDMPELYAAMDIFVLASDAEPCGRVLFEAMASGKPVVATDTGGTPEIVRDGVDGILVRPRDPEALASALGRLIEDKRTRMMMGSAGRDWIVGEFSIERNARATEQLYERLLTRHRNG